MMAQGGGVVRAWARPPGRLTPGGERAAIWARV